MYGPTWVSPRKLASAWAEGAATILTATGLFVAIRAHRQRCLHTDHDGACLASRRSTSGAVRDRTDLACRRVIRPRGTGFA